MWWPKMNGLVRFRVNELNQRILIYCGKNENLWTGISQSKRQYPSGAAHFSVQRAARQPGISLISIEMTADKKRTKLDDRTIGAVSGSVRGPRTPWKRFVCAIGHASTRVWKIIVSIVPRARRRQRTWLSPTISPTAPWREPASTHC
jgi:hypothetical protein